MANGDSISPDDTGKVGFRDIYRAVGESEGRLSKQLIELGDRLGGVSADHETRIRTIEQAVSPLAVVAAASEARLATVEALTQANAALLAIQAATRAGTLATLGLGKTALLVLAGVAGPLITIIALATRGQ